MSYRLVAARAGARVLRAPGWLRVVRSSPSVVALRADAARTVLDVAAALALAARADSTAAPTWPVLMETTGHSRATVARALAWLRAHGLLVTLENGSTPQFRSTPRPRRDRPAPVEVQGNRAAVYLLTEPLPEPSFEAEAGRADDQPLNSLQTHRAPGSAHRAEPPRRDEAEGISRLETPPHLSLRERLKNNPARAREHTRETPSTAEAVPTVGASTSPLSSAAGKSAQKPGGGSHAALDTPPSSEPLSEPRRKPLMEPRTEPQAEMSRGQRRASDLAAAAALRQRALDLRALSAAAVRSVIRGFLAAGWSVEDLVWAIDHTPDGKTRTYTAGPTAAAATASAARNGLTAEVAEEVAAEVATERRRRGVLADGGAPSARPVAFPAAWLRWRLAPWVGLAGPVGASRAAAAERSAAARAAAAQRRQAERAVRAAAVAPPAAFTQARAELRRTAPR